MLSALLLLAVAADGPCRGSSTPDVNACLGDQVSAAERVWHRYADAARKRIAVDAREAAKDTMAAETPAMFERAETAWQAYRDAECKAVFADWSGGTIRTAMGLGCSIRLTKQHTHVLWEMWLTYEDSTPPVLPEPDSGGGDAHGRTVGKGMAD